MNNAWTDRWNERYSKDGFAYGKEPNNYFRQQLQQLPAGKILLPAEGEGRNAVYASLMGWTVSAFDISVAGKNKALDLAATNGVNINYLVGELQRLNYDPSEFDAIALIYAHVPAAIKSSYHRILDSLLRKGGTIIFEAFSKSHIEYNLKDNKVGGPTDPAMLFSVEEIRADFPDYEVIELTEQEIGLIEGSFHNGVGSVIRFTGRKK